MRGLLACLEHQVPALSPYPGPPIPIPILLLSRPLDSSSMFLLLPPYLHTYAATVCQVPPLSWCSFLLCPYPSLRISIAYLNRLPLAPPRAYSPTYPTTNAPVSPLLCCY
eukprot:1927027-Rhodomonas_salina.1